MVPQVDANVSEKQAGVSLLSMMFNDTYRCKTRFSELRSKSVQYYSQIRNLLYFLYKVNIYLEGGLRL
jgi:hypothetical protein